MKKFLSLCIALAVTASMSITAFGAETVKINGYPGHAVGEDEVTAEFQISISNVVKKDGTKYLPDTDTYICQAPTVVTALDKLAFFGGETLVQDGDSYTSDQYLGDIKGSVEYYNGEVKAYEAEVEGEAGEGFDFLAGSAITLNTPGIYRVYGIYGALEGGAEAVIVIEDTESGNTAPSAPVVPAISSVTASPTSSKVLVNGQEISFEAYSINDNNYFKLRDVAKAVSGSGKQFEVTWDESKKAINLVSGQVYTVAGGELVKGDGANKNAVSCTSAIYKDGAAVELTAYTINGNNYFKLRDLGQAFDFGVSWDGVNNAVVIDTNTGYTAN